MTNRHDYPELQAAEPKRDPVPHWLDRSWIYHKSVTHADSSDFRRRQQERMLQAQRQRAA